MLMHFFERAVSESGSTITATWKYGKMEKKCIMGETKTHLMHILEVVIHSENNHENNEVE